MTESLDRQGGHAAVLLGLRCKALSAFNDVSL